MGQCIAGGAYLPALSDLIVMVRGSSFMGLGGQNLVKGATGQTIDGETLGGAVTHTEVSGVAHYAVDDDAACLAKLRELLAAIPGLSVDRSIGHVARQARPAGDRSTDRPSVIRSPPRRSPDVVRHASRARGAGRRRQARGVPGESREGDDLRR